MGLKIRLTIPPSSLSEQAHLRAHIQGILWDIQVFLPQYDEEQLLGQIPCFKT